MKHLCLCIFFYICRLKLFWNAKPHWGECQLVFYQSTQVCFGSGCPYLPYHCHFEVSFKLAYMEVEYIYFPPHLLSTESIFIIYVEVYKPWSQTTAKQSNLSCSPRPCRYSYIFQEHLSSMELVMHLEQTKKIPISYPNVNISLNHIDSGRWPKEISSHWELLCFVWT